MVGALAYLVFGADGGGDKEIKTYKAKVKQPWSKKEVRVSLSHIQGDPKLF